VRTLKVIFLKYIFLIYLIIAFLFVHFRPGISCQKLRYTVPNLHTTKGKKCKLLFITIILKGKMEFYPEATFLMLRSAYM